MNHLALTMMEDDALRKAFAARLKELRKQKGLTQKELAQRIGANYQQLNKYECGLHTPPLDKLVSLAEALETTVDYLVTGDPAQNVPLHNTQLLERFKALEGFNAQDQETVIKLIDAMIVKQRVESAVQPVGAGKRANSRTGTA
jgi:transcriptional regulator with XRE-family HTH domain